MTNKAVLKLNGKGKVEIWINGAPMNRTFETEDLAMKHIYNLRASAPPSARDYEVTLLSGEVIHYPRIPLVKLT